jgi:hypothetical protein
MPAVCKPLFQFPTWPGLSLRDVLRVGKEAEVSMKFLRVLRRISLEFICYWVLTTLLFAGVTIWAVFYVGVQYANFVLGLLVSMMVVFTILRGFAGVFGFVETIPIYLSMILIIPLVLIGRKDLAECILGLRWAGYS